MLRYYNMVMEKLNSTTNDTQVLGKPYDTLINDLFLAKDGSIVGKRMVFQIGTNTLCFVEVDGIIVGSLNEERKFVEYNPNYTEHDIEKWKHRLLHIAHHGEPERFWLML